MSSELNVLRGRRGEGPPVAPVGWKWAAGTRMRDMYFYSPTGQMFRSRISLAKYLATIENPPPMDAFQWKYSHKDDEGLPLPGISESSKDADTNIADPKKKRKKSEEREKEKVAELKKKRRKLEEKEKEKEKQNTKVAQPKKNGRKLEEEKKKKKKEKEENENENEYIIDIEGCKKLDDSASYYVLPSHIKNQQQSAENNDLDDSYYLTPNERAIIAQNENPPMQLTETLGPEESCLNDTYFVHKPSGMTCSVPRKRRRQQALLDMEEYRFEMNRPLLLIKSAMERVNMLISHFNIKQETGEETKEMEFEVHDLVQRALKQVDPQLCQLLSNGYDALSKLSSTLEEKAKEYEAKIHKFDELSAMFMLNARISSCIKQHNKSDRENPEKFFSNEEISKIKEIYRDDGEKIVADLRKDVFQTCRRISKRFLRDVPKLQKELEITH